jgi:hypothetical protein
MTKPKKQPAAETAKGGLRPDHFTVWVTLPKVRRPVLRSAAARLDLTMSQFARLAIEDAIRRVEAGEVPFEKGGDRG